MSIFNSNIYKKFNPELKTLNKNQLLLHWKTIGIYENRIYNIKIFSEKYPHFNLNAYKIQNNQLKNQDDLTIMTYYHLNYKNIDNIDNIEKLDNIDNKNIDNIDNIDNIEKLDNIDSKNIENLDKYDLIQSKNIEKLNEFINDYINKYYIFKYNFCFILFNFNDKITDKEISFLSNHFKNIPIYIFETTLSIFNLNNSYIFQIQIKNNIYELYSFFKNINADYFIILNEIIQQCYFFEKYMQKNFNIIISNNNYYIKKEYINYYFMNDIDIDKNNKLTNTIINNNNNHKFYNIINYLNQINDIPNLYSNIQFVFEKLLFLDLKKSIIYIDLNNIQSFDFILNHLIHFNFKKSILIIHKPKNINKEIQEILNTISFLDIYDLIELINKNSIIPLSLINIEIYLCFFIDYYICPYHSKIKYYHRLFKHIHFYIDIFIDDIKEYNNIHIYNKLNLDNLNYVFIDIDENIYFIMNDKLIYIKSEVKPIYFFNEDLLNYIFKKKYHIEKINILNLNQSFIFKNNENQLLIKNQNNIILITNNDIIHFIKQLYQSIFIDSSLIINSHTIFNKIKFILYIDDNISINKLNYLVEKIEKYDIFCYDFYILSEIPIHEKLPNNIKNIIIHSKNNLLLILNEYIDNNDFIIFLNDYNIFQYDLHFLMIYFVLFQFNYLHFENTLLTQKKELQNKNCIYSIYLFFNIEQILINDNQNNNIYSIFEYYNSKSKNICSNTKFMISQLFKQKEENEHYIDNQNIFLNIDKSINHIQYNLKMNIIHLNKLKKYLYYLKTKNINITIFFDKNNQYVFDKQNINSIHLNEQNKIDFIVLDITLFNQYQSFLNQNYFHECLFINILLKNKKIKLFNYKNNKINNIIDNKNIHDDYLKINKIFENSCYKTIFHYSIFIQNYFMHFLYQDIMNIYVINLKNRCDKKKYITHHLNKHKIIHYNIYYGKKIEKKELNNYDYIKTETFLNYLNLRYILGASGCKISHYELIQKINKDRKYSLILEDDVSLEDNFLYYIYYSFQTIEKENIDFDLLYLGVNLEKKEDAELLYPNLLKVYKPKTTTAYIINHDSIPKILSSIKNSSNEIDEVYSYSELNRYCIYPMIAHQENLSSDIVNENNYSNYHEKFDYTL